jgi:hypothetical protein
MYSSAAGTFPQRLELVSGTTVILSGAKNLLFPGKHGKAHKLLSMTDASESLYI